MNQEGHRSVPNHWENDVRDRTTKYDGGKCGPSPPDQCGEKFSALPTCYWNARVTLTISLYPWSITFRNTHCSPVLVINDTCSIEMLRLGSLRVPKNYVLIMMSRDGITITARAFLMVVILLRYCALGIAAPA